VLLEANFRRLGPIPGGFVLLGLRKIEPPIGLKVARDPLSEPMGTLGSREALTLVSDLPRFGR
jgi:hypothetical protein